VSQIPQPFAGVLRLDRKIVISSLSIWPLKYIHLWFLQEILGHNSSLFLSNNLLAAMSNSRSALEDVDKNNMVDGDDPEVDTGKALGNRQTNKKPETEEEKYIQTQRGIFTPRPFFNT